MIGQARSSDCEEVPLVTVLHFMQRDFELGVRGCYGITNSIHFIAAKASII